MKRKTRLAICLIAAANLLALIGCSQGQSPRLANILTFPLDQISDITISYDDEALTFYESEGDELTIREYMTDNRPSYYAKVKQGRSSIQITEGGKPLLKGGFSRYIEVYLPASYRENLTVTTTDGSIDLSGLDLSLGSLRIDSTAGTVRLGQVKAQSIDLSSTSGAFELDSLAAETIQIRTTSGSVACAALRGNVTYTTTSGDADIQSAAGAGCYTASNSGKLKLVYTHVTGDLSLFNKNGEILLTLPAGLEFDFEAATKNGAISTSFQECVSAEGGTVTGTVGAHPTVTVQAETKNGTIEVWQ